ncbi:MAG: glycerol acyltransferase [Bacteroidales bacterium]|nr:glycerol acyltransferase [Bacteroidales bacterium]
MEETPLYIDVKSVVAKKNAKLSRWIPEFGYRFLRKLIHEQELNQFLSQVQGKTGIDFVRGALQEMGISSQCFGLDQIPDQGRFIFASNHPLGGLDGLVMMDQIARKFPKMLFVANDLLMHVAPLKSIFLPVNKHGRQSLQYASMIREGFMSEAQLLYFPAGICSRKIGKNITDLQWNPNFVKKAIHYQRDIIPVYFEGRNSDFFYRLANLRKNLRIRTNIEMAFLVDEMFRQKGSSLKIWFGEPISWTLLDHSKSSQEWADWIRETVYHLPDRKNQ